MSTIPDSSNPSPSPHFDLFSWKPPLLVARPRRDQVMPTMTRDPGFLNRHFSDNIKLRHVKHLPTLIHDLADDIETKVTDEREVAGFYERTTATFCLGLASSLALGVPSLLRWSQSADGSGHAIADGFLYFSEPTNLADRYVQLERGIDKEKVKHIRLMAEKVAALATYEFRNLASGREEAMLAVPNLSNMPEFEWTSCKDANCFTLHEGEHTTVRKFERNVGPDAKCPIWTLKDHPGAVQSSSSKRKRSDDSIDQSKVDPFVPSKTPSSRLTKPLPTRRSSRLAQDKVTSTIPPPTLHMGASLQTGPAKGKGKEVEVRNDNEDVEKQRGPSFEDKDDWSALDIVQQLWAEATKADTTIMVAQSGNFEFIAIRHRRSQTLYVSDVIQPHTCDEPSYGKIHIGIYVAAVLDVIDRAEQCAAGNRDNLDSGGLSGGPSHSSGEHKDAKKPRAVVMHKREAARAAVVLSSMKVMAVQDIAAKQTLRVANQRNIFLMYLQYGVYDSPVPATFIRARLNGDRVSRPLKKIHLDECFFIVLKSEIGHGATGDVLRGELSVEESSESEFLDIVVKLALGNERCDALRREYIMYHQLKESGVTAGITTPLGLFYDVEGGASALVMPYVGRSLAKMPEFVLTPSYQEAVLANLKDIHSANVLHGDIRLDNILVADSGLMIVDFALSEECHDSKAKKREYKYLRSLLAEHSKGSEHNTKTD